ncbi:MAG: MFS transporter [Pseudomonadota bacterium]
MPHDKDTQTAPDAALETDTPDSAAPSSPQERRRAFTVLLFCVMAFGVGQTVIFAVLPPIARDLGVGDQQVLSIFMASALFWTFSSAQWGRLSDRYGRRPFVLLGLAGFGASMLAFAWTLRASAAGVVPVSILFLLLMVARCIHGGLGSAMFPAAQAYVADRTPPEKRTAGVAGLTAAFGFGAMIGPGVAAAMTRIGPIAPLFATASLAWLAAAAVYFGINEKMPPKERAATPKLSFFDNRIRVYLAFGGALALANAVQTQFTTFYVIDRLGAETADATRTAGFALAAAASAMLFAQVVLVQRLTLQPRTLMRVGPLFVALGHGLVALSTTAPSLFVGMAFTGLGAGLTMPGFISAASLSVTKKEQGAVAGLAGAATASSYIFAPLLGYPLYAIAPEVLFITTALLAAGAGLFVTLNAEVGAPPQNPNT